MKRAKLEWEDGFNDEPLEEYADLRFGRLCVYARVWLHKKTGKFEWEIGEWVGEGQDEHDVGTAKTIEGAKLAAEVAMANWLEINARDICVSAKKLSSCLEEVT